MVSSSAVAVALVFLISMVTASLVVVLAVLVAPFLAAAAAAAQGCGGREGDGVTEGRARESV